VGVDVVDGVVVVDNLYGGVGLGGDQVESSRRRPLNHSINTRRQLISYNQSVQLDSNWTDSTLPVPHSSHSVSLTLTHSLQILLYYVMTYLFICRVIPAGVSGTEFDPNTSS
jgi:hypothetical protein